MTLTTTPGRNELPWQPLRRLGDASLSGYRRPYPGVDEVVNIAKTWIENYRSEQFIRDKALQITGSIRKHPRSNHPDMRDFDAIAKAIHDFIVKEIKYVRDQNEVERLQTPDATLLLKAGDCDDMVILGGALLESVGVPTRIKLIGQKTGQFSHIYLEYQANGQWKSFDPTLALYPGYVFPKKNIKAEKTVKIDREANNSKTKAGLSSGSEFLNDFVQPPKTRKIMESNFVHYESDEGLGIDPVTIATGTSLIKHGVKLFGKKGSDPNYSSKSLTDTVANFEKISGGSASRIADQLIQEKLNGASDYDLAQIVARAGGYSVSQITSSKKWPLVKNQLAMEVSRAQQSQTKTTAMSTGKSAAGANSPAGGQNLILIGGGGLFLLGIAALALRKKDK